jgi:hypothetical protein
MLAKRLCIGAMSRAVGWLVAGTSLCDAALLASMGAILRSIPSSWERSEVEVADLTSIVEALSIRHPHSLCAPAATNLAAISIPLCTQSAHRRQGERSASALALLDARRKQIAAKKIPQTKSRFYAGVTMVRSGNSSAIKVLRGALGEIRTPDPQIRSLVLYPAELRAPAAHHSGFGANVTCIGNDDRAMSRVVCFGRTLYGSRNMSS